MKRIMIILISLGVLLSGTNIFFGANALPKNVENYEMDITFDEAEPSQTSWTIMLYIVGDGKKGDHPPEDGEKMFVALNNLEKAGSNQNVKIVLQFDDFNVWNHNTRRFLIKKDQDSQNAQDFLLKYEEGVNMWTLGEQNSGDPDTLHDFLDWATQQFPAQHYALIMFGHGAGWEGICNDYTSGWTIPDAVIDINELESAFNDVPQLDILFLWGCSMGMLEVYYQLQTCSKTILASESSMSFNLNVFLDPFDYWVTHPSVSYEEMASQLVDTYEWAASHGGPTGMKTLFAIYTQKYSGSTSDINILVEMVDSLSQSLLEGYQNRSDYVHDMVENAFKESEIIFEYPDEWAHDLFELVYSIDKYIEKNPDENMEEIQQDAKAVKNAVEQVEKIIPTGAEENGTHGFAIYSPRRLIFYRPFSYPYIEFCENTKWDEFLLKYFFKRYIKVGYVYNDDVIVGEAMKFSCVVEGGTEPYTYFWDFGDGTISYEQNPTHIYTQAGEYPIKLTVVDRNGNSASEEFTVIINKSNLY